MVRIFFTRHHLECKKICLERSGYQYNKIFQWCDLGHSGIKFLNQTKNSSIGFTSYLKMQTYLNSKERNMFVKWFCSNKSKLFILNFQKITIYFCNNDFQNMWRHQKSAKMSPSQCLPNLCEYFRSCLNWLVPVHAVVVLIRGVAQPWLQNCVVIWVKRIYIWITRDNNSASD